MNHLIVSVHGIRTYGQWSSRLASAVQNIEPTAECVNYSYGYFSFIAFLFPPLRWLATRRFRQTLIRLATAHNWDRIDIVAHSFGTHLVGWALHSMPVQPTVQFHTVILAGSVLRSRFRWDEIIPVRVRRLVNECGDRDFALVASQLFVFLTGMAGRTGFVGPLSRRFQNRYFDFGHSDYFTDDFMQRHWVPLLVSELDTPSIDERPPLTIVRGMVTTALNNAEPFKLGGYVLCLLAMLFWIGGALLQSEVARDLLTKEVERANTLLDTSREQLASALVGVGRSRLDSRPDEAANYAAVAFRLTKTMAPVELFRDAALRYPQYMELAPQGSRRSTSEFMPNHASATDVFAISPDGSRVVLHKSSPERSSTKAIAIRDVESGSEIAVRNLVEGDSFLAPDPSRSRYFAIHNQPTGRLSLFDMEGASLDLPIIEVEEVVTAAMAEGSFPMHVLTRDGEVIEIDMDSQQRIQRSSLGHYAAAVSLSTHPEGRGLAILEPSRVVVLEHGKVLIATQQIWTERECDPQVIWGPRADTFLLSLCSDKVTRWLGFDADGASRTIWASKTNDTCCTARARNGSRFVIGDRQAKEGRATVQVIDVSWPESASGQARVRDIDLAGPMPGTSLLELKALTIRDDGKIAIASYDVTGYSGTQLSTSQTEMWDLGSLDHQTSLAPQAVILRSSGGPVRRMGLTRDGSTLVLWDGEEYAHVFKVSGQLQRRLVRYDAAYSGDGSRTHVQYEEAVASYDRSGGQPLVLEAPPRNRLAMNFWRDRLIILTPNEILHLNVQGTLHRLPLADEAVDLVASGDAWIVRTRHGLALFDPLIPAKLGELSGSATSGLLAALDDQGHLRTTSIVKSSDERYTLCGEYRSESSSQGLEEQATARQSGFQQGELGCWILRRTEEGSIAAERTLTHLPDVPKGGELLYQIVNRPVGLDLIFVLQRVKDRHDWLPERFSMLSVLDGQSATAYDFPKALTDDFRGIVWSRVDNQALVVVGQFLGTDFADQLGVCRFPVAGGKCDAWIPLPPGFRQVEFSNDDNITLTGEDAEGPIGALVRISDGRVLWRSKLLTSGILPLLEPEGDSSWRIADYAEWAELSRTVALGGDPDIFKRATKLRAADLDQELVHRLETQVTQAVPPLDRWDLLRARALSSYSAIRTRLAQWLNVERPISSVHAN